MNPQNPPNPSSVPTGGSTFGTSNPTSGGTLTDTKQAVAQTARDAASKVKGAASTTLSRAREEAERVAREKKEEAARRIGSYSSAIHESARSFEEQDPNIAWFTHRAADRLQGVADYVRTRDFMGLRDDAANVARRHPAVFFGGMFVAGLLLGNLVKASQRRADEQDDGYGFDRSSEWDATTGTDTGAQPDLPMSTSPLPSASAGI